ncbi:MAG TPA: hypothetical protein VH229_04025, partial [Candidatus Udaeobacter sp.]|nr:hypothetical protein [Candidatus Udaeobacter sp.]
IRASHEGSSNSQDASSREIRPQTSVLPKPSLLVLTFYCKSSRYKYLARGEPSGQRRWFSFAFVLPGADERTAWSVDAWLKMGPFDLIGEFLEERVDPRTVNGVPPGFSRFTTDGFYVTGAYFLVPKKRQLAARWEHLNPGQK